MNLFDFDENTLNSDWFPYLVFFMFFLFCICIFVLNKYNIFQKYDDLLEYNKNKIYNFTENIYNKHIEYSIQNGKYKTIYPENNYLRKVLENIGIL
jgi:hypothetical protein